MQKLTKNGQFANASSIGKISSYDENETFLRFKFCKIKIVSFSSKCLLISFLIKFCIISMISSFSSNLLKSTLEITEKILFKGKLKKFSFLDNFSIFSLNKSSYVSIFSFLLFSLISSANLCHFFQVRLFFFFFY